MLPLEYHHVDVFTSVPCAGNNVAIFPTSGGLDTAQMGAITREMRHFESLFLDRGEGPFHVRARVFDLEGERIRRIRAVLKGTGESREAEESC